MSKFEELVVRQRYDEQSVIGALRPYVRFAEESRELVWLPATVRLGAKARILVYLMARIALNCLGWNPQIAARPMEVTQATGLPAGTVRPRLRELLEKARLVSQEANGYFVPPHAVPFVTSFIQKEVSDDES